MVLSVKAPRRQKNRISEATFEGKFGKGLKVRGLYSWHTSDQFKPGVPDRYVVGGNWIEFKAIPYTGKRAITPERFLSPAQKNELTRLHESGDRAWVCILFQPEQGEATVMLCPWVVLRDKGQMTRAEIEDASLACGTAAALQWVIDTRFNLNDERYSVYHDWAFHPYGGSGQ